MGIPTGQQIAKSFRRCVIRVGVVSGGPTVSVPKGKPRSEENGARTERRPPDACGPTAGFHTPERFAVLPRFGARPGEELELIPPNASPPGAASWWGVEQHCYPLAPHEMAPVAPDMISELIDHRFRVEKKLGEGGMGTVWQVQHVESLQRFALKTLVGALGYDASVVERFRREARAAAALRTRHVVRVIDVQMGYRHRSEPLPFIVMELLEGRNLEQLVTESGRLAPGQLLWVLRQVGRALAAAHGQGIVHRDLKPANVFIAIDEDGEPIAKLCDFGIAKLLGESAHALQSRGAIDTSTGGILGTPLYMAPEQLRSARQVVPATDQWALALIAFRALVGCEYFADSQSATELVLRIAQDPMLPPSSRALGLARSFDTWFLRSCARTPGERFASVTEQVEALEEALGRPQPQPIDPRFPNLQVAATELSRGGTRNRPGQSSSADASPANRPVSGAPAATSAPAPEASAPSGDGPQTHLTQAISSHAGRTAKGSPGLVGIVTLGLATIAALFALHHSASRWLDDWLAPRSLASSPSPGESATVAASSPVNVGSAQPSSKPEPLVAPVLASSSSEAQAATNAGPPPEPRKLVLRKTERIQSPPPRKEGTKPEGSLRPPRRKAGEGCSRSSECESGLCLAEACR